MPVVTNANTAARLTGGNDMEQLPAITKAQDYLRWQAQGNLISGPEWAALVREMLIAWALHTEHKR